MILSCYNILNKRIRITIIEGWNNILRYVPEFVFTNMDRRELSKMSSSDFYRGNSIFIDIVGVDVSSNSIYNRLTLVMSVSSLLEALEILTYHFLNENNFEIVDAISMQCDYLSN